MKLGKTKQKVDIECNSDYIHKREQMDKFLDGMAQTGMFPGFTKIQRYNGLTASSGFNLWQWLNEYFDIEMTLRLKLKPKVERKAKVKSWKTKT